MELRMYSLVLYQLRDIQAGIQSGHANVEYGVKHGFTGRWLDWATNWKTVIVLNGGSSITFTAAVDALKENGIEHCEFIEPDLYAKALSVSFLVDERVFNKVLYPDFDRKYLLSLYDTVSLGDEKVDYPEDYEKWVKSIGGEKNVFLRTWLRQFRLA